MLDGDKRLRDLEGNPIPGAGRGSARDGVKKNDEPSEKKDKAQKTEKGPSPGGQDGGVPYPPSRPSRHIGSSFRRSTWTISTGITFHWGDFITCCCLWM